MRRLNHIARKAAGLLPLMFLFILLLGCDGENAPDCFQASGDLVTEEIAVEEFDEITVFENIRLVLRHGPEYKVELKTGSNLRQEVSAEVVDGVLELRDGNDCNYFRSYGTTVFTVTAPDLKRIRSSTGFPVQSEGVLPYESLALLSESFNDPEAATTDGSFELELDVENLSIVANGIAFFSLKGEADIFSVTIAAGDSRVEARELVTSELKINHRGSNDILVFPVN
ncbi:MAG: DUF2807 domain-containing protein, partial [Flavobacteriaceae bacterium]|nr:DUF2807 domain-containing protein [Flavobacteriaceae bacterium]